jgi:hypothetical protein
LRLGRSDAYSTISRHRPGQHCAGILPYLDQSKLFYRRAYLLLMRVSSRCAYSISCQYGVNMPDNLDQLEVHRPALTPRSV